MACLVKESAAHGLTCQREHGSWFVLSRRARLVACLVKESEAHGLSSQGECTSGLSVWGGEGTAPGFVAPEWALVVIQPKTLIIPSELWVW